MSKARHAHHAVHAGILLSVLPHIFCCGLPTAFTLTSLFAGFGVMVIRADQMEALHHVLHVWEMPLLAFSLVMTAIGWAMHLSANKAACSQPCCGDHGCSSTVATEPVKRSCTILIITTALVAINTAVLLFGH
jgi:hypothetical protein